MCVGRGGQRPGIECLVEIMVNLDDNGKYDGKSQSSRSDDAAVPISELSPSSVISRIVLNI